VKFGISLKAKQCKKYPFAEVSLPCSASMMPRPFFCGQCTLLHAWPPYTVTVQLSTDPVYKNRYVLIKKIIVLPHLSLLIVYTFFYWSKRISAPYPGLIFENGHTRPLHCRPVTGCSTFQAINLKAKSFHEDNAMRGVSDI
jgi:hypothetical protein